MIKKFLKWLIQYYLKILTKIVLWRQKPMVIAVAGTTNKTFVKDRILEEIDKKKFSIRGNPRSFNTEIGLPLAVLFLPSGYSSVFKWVDVLLAGTYISFFSRKFPRILVLEMGVDKRGDMKYLLSMVKPQMGVITNIDKSFPHNQTSLDDIALEIKELIKAVPKDGLVVLNSHDKRVASLEREAFCKCVNCGEKEECQAMIKNIKEDVTGQKFDLLYQGKNEKMQVDGFGKHNIFSSVAATIIVDELNRKLTNKNEN